MSIEVTCVECSTSHRVNRNMAGRRVRCPHCDAVVHVPEAGPDSLDDTAESADSAIESTADQQVADVNPVQVTAVDSAIPDQGFANGGNDDENYLSDSAIHLPHAESVSPAAPIDTHIMVLDDQQDVDEVLVRAKLPADEMDMTPMVDVTFLLLIFFMVTAAFSLQKSIQMPRQQTDAPSVNTEEVEDELDVVEVQVDEFGSFLVMAADWERETPGKQNLITALREAIAGNRDGMKLDVKVHELAKLHALVDALDAGTIAGFSDLKVTQVEEFE